MTLFSKLTQDKLYLTGLIAIAFSFCGGFFQSILHREPTGGLFIFNFGVAFFYFLSILISGRLRRGRNGLPLLFLFFILFLISAYVLNREIQIFHVSTDWLTALLIVSCVNYTLVFWYDDMPQWLKLTHVFIMGISLLLFVYLAFYLVPQYAFSAVFFWVLLLPVHSFVPLFFVIYTIIWLLKISVQKKAVTITIWLGIGAATLGVVVYIITWAIQVENINRYYREADRDVNKTLPTWVRTASKISASWLTECILKTDARFGTADVNGINRNFFWNFPEIRRNNEFRHDPLIMIATFFGNRLNMPVEERLQILQAVFNDRHQSEERLWSGEELYTEEVDTKIQIWPQYRIAYTDMTVKVRCGYNDARWTREEEAIYSFYLPEGSAVTALSLWIDGKESPGILTTRQKADTAYKTIVGRERRDPSVLHWQEGNRVSVRVFPVMPGSNRQFRVGVTTPLQMKKGRLEYQSIDLDGPSQLLTKNPVFVEMMGRAGDLTLPAGFDSIKNNSFERSGGLKSGWSISMAAMPTDTTAFSFKGYTYNAHEYAHHRNYFQPENIYLDINNAWTKQEFDQALKLPGNHNVFVCTDEKLAQVNNTNAEKLFEELHLQQFSLFPVHQIPNADTALLITKNQGGSPNLRELKETKFLDSLKAFVTPRPRIRMFCIDGALSPYLSTLKEYRVFKYEQGSMDDCSLLLARKEFSMDIENENQVVIDHSSMMITRSKDSAAGKAPDHLMRLFVYNHVMQQAGAGLLNGEVPADPLVAEAAEAHVVTPVSSLVVLETQKDYERFNINDIDGLGNAVRSSNGAVPEPHEWALIILAVVILFTLKFGPVWKRKWN